jgi:hypothetical protein
MELVISYRDYVCAAFVLQHSGLVQCVFRYIEVCVSTAASSWLGLELDSEELGSDELAGSVVLTGVFSGSSFADLKVTALAALSRFDFCDRTDNLDFIVVAVALLKVLAGRRSSISCVVS